MALSQKIEIGQTTTLIMTPQLQQAIKLLQLSNLELLDFVEQELERNPLLERQDDVAQTVNGEAREELFNGEPPAPEAAPDSDGDGFGDGPVEKDSVDLGQSETLPNDSRLDADYENDYSSDSAPPDDGGFMEIWRAGGQRSDFVEDDRGIEQTLSGAVTLRHHLSEQIAVDIADPVMRMVATYMLDQLDDSGYLAAPVAEIAGALGCGEDLVEATLERVQRLDPAGVFARSLSECLALQLRERDRLDPAMQALIENLELLGKRDAATLMRLCAVDEEDLRDMVAEIRALDPKPALIFDSQTAQPVTPDILMRAKPGGGWILELNSETLPRVLVNTRYYREVSRTMRKGDDRDYLTERYHAANWLVKSLHQRANTILKVASEIVAQQQAFFDKGVRHLRPLILKDIAEQIEMHESTVSRVTTNKFIATPRGVFELKYFFTSAIAGAMGGEAHSAEAVRHRIKTLIDDEAPERILSDDKIVEILRDQGVDIARRTVAKYREAMRIPSSVQRRREKASQI